MSVPHLVVFGTIEEACVIKGAVKVALLLVRIDISAACITRHIPFIGSGARQEVVYLAWNVFDKNVSTTTAYPRPSR